MNIRELLIKIGVDAGDSTRELDRIDRQTDKVKRGFQSLNGVLTALFAGGAIKSILGTADAMQNLQSQIGTSTGDMANANAKFNELAGHAKDTRQNLDAYVGSWAKMNSGIKQFGGTADDTTRFMDTLGAAFTSNGTAAESSRAALFQLGQTMQSGVVQGEEMNSLMDAQGELYHDLAVGIGGTVVGYKKMQAAGKVTGKMLMEQVNKLYPKYMKRLHDMPMTLGQTWENIMTDVKTGINGVNDSTKAIPKLAAKIMKGWNMLTAGIGDLIKQMGGLDNALTHLGRVATPLGVLLGVLLGFKALAFLTSPIGLIIGLGLAIGALYDDYLTWKEGGESFINWAQWKPEIDAAKDGINGIRDALKNLMGIDLSTWSIKGELADITEQFKSLVEMGNHAADMLNALAKGDFTAAAAAGKALMTQGQDKSSATPGVQKSAESAREQFNAPFQAIDDYVEGFFKKYLLPNGSGMGGNNAPAATVPVIKPVEPTDRGKATSTAGDTNVNTAPAGVQMPAAGAPGAALPKTTTVNNNVTAPQTINVTNNITAAPGQDPAAIGNAVTNQMQFKLKDYGFDANSLVNAGGAK